MAKDPSSNTTNDREDLVQNTENPQGLDPASDSDLDGASGGSFWSVVTDVLDDVVHVMPFTGPISDGVEMAVTGKTHMQNSIERSLNQAEIAGDAGDTSVGSVIGRAFLPNTYDEAQRKYVDKKFDEAMRDDLSS